MDLPCSDASRLRGEPMLATASRVDRWLLVEHCAAWGPPAVPLARTEPALRTHLVAQARQAGARLVLLRHPRGQDCPPGRHVFVVDSRPGRESMQHKHFSNDVELVDSPLNGTGWEPFDGPLLLVCTHGKHDRCCAVRGRPVAETLSLRYPERTYECSHVGGDRFAANLVVLPEGYYVSRVEAGQAPEVVAALWAGRLPLEHLRGRSSLPLPVQAAQHFARTQLDRDGADDLLLGAQSGDGPDTWVVRLAGALDLPDVEVRVHYHRAAVEPARLTCRATQDSAAPQFTCEGLRALTG